MDCGLIHWKPRGFSAKMRMADCWVDLAADWTATWRCVSGAVCHVCGGRADVAGWTGSTVRGGPKTKSNRYSNLGRSFII